MLLHRVARGQHIEYLFLVTALLDSELVALPLHVEDLVSLHIQNCLALLKRRLELSLLLSALLELPFCVVG